MTSVVCLVALAIVAGLILDTGAACARWACVWHPCSVCCSSGSSIMESHSSEWPSSQSVKSGRSVKTFQKPRLFYYQFHHFDLLSIQPIMVSMRNLYLHFVCVCVRVCACVCVFDPQVVMCGCSYLALFMGNFFTTLGVVYQKYMDNQDKPKSL